MTETITKPIPLVLKPEDWPKSDQALWHRFFTPGNLFEDPGPFSNWSEGSRRKRRQGYGQWLSFLKRTDPHSLKEVPAARITRDRVRDFIEECEARLKPKSVSNHISDLFVLARAMDPARDWDWLQTASKRLIAVANRQSLPPPLPITAGEIFGSIALHLSDVEENDSLSDLKRAIHFRRVLMIGVLVARPVRRRALLAMTVTDHVIQVGEGYHLKFSGKDMKTGRAQDFPLPQDLAEPMRRYLAFYRPTLLAEKALDALWISQYGEPITPDGLSRELPKNTERLLGIALRPHAFRHVAATSIAECDPEHVGIIRDILGHATLDMAEKHYNRATGIKACDNYQSLIEDIRGSVPKGPNRSATPGALPNRRSSQRD